MVNSEQIQKVTTSYKRPYLPQYEYVWLSFDPMVRGLLGLEEEHGIGHQCMPQVKFRLSRPCLRKRRVSAAPPLRCVIIYR